MWLNTAIHYVLYGNTLSQYDITASCLYWALKGGYINLIQLHEGYC